MITEMVKDVKNVNQEGAKNIMSGRPNKKMFATMVKKHGSEEAAREWFRSIGRRGGQNGNTCGILFTMSRIKKVQSHPRYRVSDDGQVFGINGKAMTPQIDRKGYLRVLLRDTSKHNSVAPKKVHRLVAEAFIPNPLGLPQVDHKDGDKSNNLVSNLEWVTNDENMRRAVERGAYSGRKPEYINIYGGQILTAIEQGYVASDLFESANIQRKTFWKYVEKGEVLPAPITTLKVGRKKKYCYYDKSRNKWRVEASDGRTGRQFNTEAEAIEYAQKPIAGGFAANPELARIAGAKAGRISKRNHKYIKSDGQYNYYIANDTGKVVKSAKLTSAQRAEALGMFDKGIKRYEIAKHFNVSPSAIGRLLAGKTWAE